MWPALVSLWSDVVVSCRDVTFIWKLTAQVSFFCGSDSATSNMMPHQQRSDAWKLLFGAGGIYVAFLWYGSLQEDVFLFQTDDGSKFTFVWFLQCMEASANIVVGVMGRRLAGGTANLPLGQFAITGCAQVVSKALTALALSSGLSFPVATLAKSGKMAPVMMGQLILGGATYTLREYSQVAAIILGTALLSLGKKVSLVYTVVV
jgi:solute carrier family 35 (UDP-galactose transporter), member B1